MRGTSPESVSKRLPMTLFEWRFASYEDRLTCRRLIRQGSRSFHAASLLLPRDLRDPAYAVYAFCRIADDKVDATGAERDALSGLRRRLDAVYEGAPLDHACDRALADVVIRHNLPRPLFDALLEGLKGAGLAVGQVFQRSTLEGMQLELQRQYVQQGRYDANIDTEVLPEPRNRVSVNIDVDAPTPSHLWQHYR